MTPARWASTTCGTAGASTPRHQRRCRARARCPPLMSAPRSTHAESRPTRRHGVGSFGWLRRHANSAVAGGILGRRRCNLSRQRLRLRPAERRRHAVLGLQSGLAARARPSDDRRRPHAESDHRQLSVSDDGDEIVTPCALDADGVAYCWGFNHWGGVGDGSTDNTRAQPTRVSTSLRFRQIMTGCGLTFDSDAYCWGYNYNGELGDGTTVSRAVPAIVVGGIKWKTISSGGWDETCGIAQDDHVYCWGYHLTGQATGIGVPRPTIISTTLTATALADGGEYGCMIAQHDQVYCWGQNLYGTIGDGTKIFRASPTPVLPP